MGKSVVSLNAVPSLRTLSCVFTGFASGIPYYILFQLIPAWLRSSEASLIEIGRFSLFGHHASL
jgi:MFS transporter, PAT family, beta-lactamase induction signal transducer AmpG